HWPARSRSELHEPAGPEPGPGLGAAVPQVVEVRLPRVAGVGAAQHVAESVRPVDLAPGHPDGVDELGVDVAAYAPEATYLGQQPALDQHRAAGHEAPVDLAGRAEPSGQVERLEVVDVVGHADQLGTAVGAGQEQVGREVGCVPVVVVHLQYDVAG